MDLVAAREYWYDIAPPEYVTLLDALPMAEPDKSNGAA